MDVYLLNLWFYLREEVDELDVGGEQELTGWNTAQVELGMHQLELHHWAETVKGSWLEKSNHMHSKGHQ